MDLSGKILGHYRLIAKIGKGGMADVYQARQESLDRTVALKVLPSTLRQDDTFQARFEREARAIARLHHPNILTVYDYGEQDDLTYIVMEYSPGGTLQDRMRRPLSLQEAIEIACHLGRALDYAHRHGVIHRDVKPSNVLLTEEGWPLLSDFGLVKIAHESTGITRPSTSMGTPEYMSPEQGQGKPVDHRTDIYALGVVLYEMVTGQPPFTADSPVGLILQHATESLPPPRLHRPDLPAGVEAVIVKALAKAPGDRYASAGDMVDALQAAWLQVQAETPDRRQNVRPKRRPAARKVRAADLSRPKRWVAAWGPALALALLICGVTLATMLVPWLQERSGQVAASTALAPARRGLATPTFTSLPNRAEPPSLTPPATATATHSPTATPSRTPTSTATATPTATTTPTPALPRAVANESASLFKSPSAESEELGIVGLGESVEIVGRADEWQHGRWLYIVTGKGTKGFVAEPRFTYTSTWTAFTIINVDRSEVNLVSTPVTRLNARLVVTPGPLQIHYIWPSSICDAQGNWTALFMIKLSGGDGRNYKLYWNDEPVDLTVKVEEPDVAVFERPGDIGLLVGTVRVESGGQRASLQTSVSKRCSD